MPSSSRKKSSSLDWLLSSIALMLILFGCAALLSSGVFEGYWPVFWWCWGILLMGILIWIYRENRSRTIADEMSMLTVDTSFLSESVNSTAKPKLRRRRKIVEDWSLELIGRFEWRVFEKMCMRLWRLKGVSIEETSGDGEVGVNFYLLSKSTKARVGVVRCKNWNKKPISVTLLHQLQAVVNEQHLPMGLLMHHGELTEQAQVFLDRPETTVKAQSSEAILAQIRELDESLQIKLLAKCIQGKYTVPSCPLCDVKLERRVSQVSGAKSLACSNFPECSYMLNPRNPHARH